MPTVPVNVVFREPVAIEVPNDIVAMALGFTKTQAVEGQAIEYYIKNRRSNPEHTDDDVCISKISEWAANRFLVDRYGFPPTEVDWAVRFARLKGWAEDLIYMVSSRRLAVHVKSTPMLYDDGKPTWTFQLGNEHDNYGVDPLLRDKVKGFTRTMFSVTHTAVAINADNDITVGTYVPGIDSKASTMPTGVVVYIYQVLWWKDVIERIGLRDPINPFFNGIKICLYYNDAVRYYGDITKPLAPIP